MIRQLNDWWYMISRIGLREGEGMLRFREVMLLNRLIVIIVIVSLTYLMIEVLLIGTALMFYTLAFIALFLFTLVLNYFRYFRAANYYIYFISAFYLLGMGLMTGKEVMNYMEIIPLVLVGAILFKNKWEKIGVFLITLGLCLWQQYLFNVVPPHFKEIVNPHEATFAIIFFLMALILTFLIGYYLISIHREFEAMILRQKNHIALKNKEITDSITYAGHLQQALLPREETWKRHLPDNFVLYKPKDIVAGDFYWMNTAEEGKIVCFAVADCTGHGVPGAFVSVVAYNALNKAVNEHGLTKPARILDKTNELFEETFYQRNKYVSDGMDVALCTWNKSGEHEGAGELQFAGAHNPLYLIRASDKNTVENAEKRETHNRATLYVVRPDMQPIGKQRNKQPFSHQKIKLQKGDVFYLFSDGYPDQFGGAEGKKFLYKRFRMLLLDIHKQPVHKQMAMLDERIMAWMKQSKEEQIDDICVIGIRV